MQKAGAGWIFRLARGGCDGPDALAVALNVGDAVFGRLEYGAVKQKVG